MKSPETYPADAKQPFGLLRRLAQQAGANEHCELCSVPLQSFHRHLLEKDKRTLVCACDACALRFQNVVDGRLKLIPRDVYTIPDLVFSDDQWESLALPIELAFLYYDSNVRRMVAMYPSPAGAMESLLPVDMWKTCARNNPALDSMEADVEAFLVNRVGTARHYYIVPIDVCYELVGLIRTHWRGLSGGAAAWAEIEKYFARLDRQARPRTNVSVECHNA